MAKRVPDLDDLVNDVIYAIQNWLDSHLNPENVLDFETVVVNDSTSDSFAIAAAKGYCLAKLEYYDYGFLVKEMLSAYRRISDAVDTFAASQGSVADFMEFLAEFLANTQVYHTSGDVIQDYGEYYEEIDQLRNEGAVGFWGCDSEDELFEMQAYVAGICFDDEILHCETAEEFLDRW